jgi:Virulence factor BrkB
MAVAAGVTFYALLSIFPAIAAFVSLYGLIGDPGKIQGYLDTMKDVLPGGAIEVISDQVKRIASKGGGALGLGLIIGLATALWSANAADMARPAAGLVPVANDPYEKWSHQTAPRSFTWPIASRAVHIFRAPQYITTSLLKLLSKHLITLRNISFQLVHFDCNFSTSYLFQIWSLFRMSHPSMSLSKGLPQSQRLPRVRPTEFQLRS